MMTKKKSDGKRSASSKRVKVPREVEYVNGFLKDWKKLSHSGKQDMKVLKEAMMLLIANDAPLPPEWKDHPLKGSAENLRECHIKGDLLLVYGLDETGKAESIAFVRVSTHSEIF